MSDLTEEFLRMAFSKAELARDHGNHPFAAVLVDDSDNVLMSAENTVITDKDVTAHAELNLIRTATANLSEKIIRTSTLYSSAEPCPMCASAMVWANLRRVVFGLSMEKLYTMFGDTGDAPTLKLKSKIIFEHAPWPVQVKGPLLEKEAILPHKNFW
jgi:tRNA(Arg) A34 adenosine deaminase TadA